MAREGWRAEPVAVRPTRDSRAGEGEWVSFDEFFTAHRDRLYRALCLVTRDPHEAEELMQDAFVRVYERWDRVRTLEDPTGYLFRTALNSFRLLRRRAAVASKHALVRSAGDEIAAVVNRDATMRALGELSPRQRAVVMLVDMLQFRTEEVASILGSRPSTVRVHLARARAHLREELAGGE
jgi:RNA polymerase sigma factor (sigma-70 family)